MRCHLSEVIREFAVSYHQLGIPKGQGVVLSLVLCEVRLSDLCKLSGCVFQSDNAPFLQAIVFSESRVEDRY